MRSLSHACFGLGRSGVNMFTNLRCVYFPFLVSIVPIPVFFDLSFVIKLYCPALFVSLSHLTRLFLSIMVLLLRT